MKRLLRYLSVMLIAVLSLSVCFSLAACEDIKKLEVKISVYDVANKKNVESTLSVDLYRHLAPDTVDAVIKYAKEGFYDGLPIYKFATDNGSQYMMGDYKLNGTAVEKNEAEYVKNIDGEFNASGVIGSDLLNKKGSVGLWRTWEAGASDNGSFTKNSDKAFSSGSATWFMPTDTLSGYNGYFCVFAQIDTGNKTNAKIYDYLSAVFADTSCYVSYTVYYTGEDYDSLEFHAETTEEFNARSDEYKESVFTAKGEQFVCYNKTEIYMPFATIGGVENSVAAKVLSVTVK